MAVDVQKEYEQAGLAKKVVAVIPAGGSGFRSTPMWTRFDAFLDTIAKPAMRDLFWRRPYLDIIFDYLIEGGVVEKVLLSVGEKPKRSKKACVSDRDKIVYQAYVDMKRLVDRRGGAVEIFFDNPGGDRGTGATAVAEEGKEILRENSQVEYILVCFGDVPTIPTEEFKKVVLEHIRSRRKFTLISAIAGDPFNYGRVVRYPKTILTILPRREVEQMRAGEVRRFGNVSVTKEQIENFYHLNQRIRDGRLIAVELPEVDTEKYGFWAKYLFLEEEDYRALKPEKRITLYHPWRECLEHGRISLTKEQIEQRRLRLGDDKLIVWDPRTDEFFDVKEQGDIGRTEKEREEIGALEVRGIEYPVSTDYLHAIVERNTGLVVMNKEIMLKTIRDLDASNYGRVIEDQKGREIAVFPNEKLQKMNPGENIVLGGRKFSREELQQVTKCRKLWETEEKLYVLERHPNGEYYLPEIAKEVKAKGDPVNLAMLFGGIGEGYDFRTDTRVGAVFENEIFTRKLQRRGVNVSPGTRFWVGGGFDIANIEPGVSFEGEICLQGDIRIKAGASLKNAEVYNYFFYPFDPPDRKRRVRENRRGLDYLVIGENSKLENAVVVNGNIGSSASLNYASVMGVDVEEGEKVHGVVIRIAPDGSVIRIPRPRRYVPPIPSGVELLDLDGEGKMLEHVYAVTIRPGSEIFTSRRIKAFLRALLEAVAEFGGAKSFCKRYINELKQQRPGALPGFQDFADLNFYIGANTVLGGKVVLAGDIYVDGWTQIHNSVIQNSRVGRNARIADSLVKESVVESSPKAISIVDSAVLIREKLGPGSIMDFSCLEAGTVQEAKQIFPQVREADLLTACVTSGDSIVAIKGTGDDELLEYLQRYSPEVWRGLMELKGGANLLVDLDAERIQVDGKDVESKKAQWLIEAIKVINKFPEKRARFVTDNVAVILGAGDGVRMRSADMPKVTYLLGSKPAINRAIEVYRRCGFRQQVVVVGRLGEEVVEQVAREHKDIVFTYQPKRLGTGHAAKQAAYLLKKKDYRGHIMVVAGDKVIAPEAINRFVDEYRRSNADAAVLVAAKTRWPNAGRVVYKSDGTLDSIVEKSDITKKMLLCELLKEKRMDGNFSNQEMLEMIRKVVPVEKKAAKMLGEQLWNRLKANSPVTLPEMERMIRPEDLVFTVRERDGRITQLTAEELEQRTFQVNTSVYLFTADAYYYALPRLSSNNAQQEEYLTDAVSILSNAVDCSGNHLFKVIAVEVEDADQVLAFNTPEELLATKESLQSRVRKILSQRGVTQMGDFENSWIDDVDSVWKIGRGTVILGTVFIDLGPNPRMKIGRNCHILGEVRIIHSALGEDCTVKNSRMENVVAGDNVVIRDSILTPDRLTVIPPGVEVLHGDLSALKSIRAQQRQVLRELRAMYAEAFRKGQIETDADYYTQGVDETNVYVDSDLLGKIVSSATKLQPGDILTGP